MDDSSANSAGIHDDPSAGDIDLRHRGVGERQHHGRAALRRLDLDQVAGAEIMDRDHGAERTAVRVDRRKADQVGVIELVAASGSGSRSRGTKSLRLVSRPAASRSLTPRSRATR